MTGIHKDPSYNEEGWARIKIDQLLEKAKWLVQSVKDAHTHAVREVILREFALNAGLGFSD